MNQRKKIYQNIAISGIYMYMNQAINFIAMIVLARLLSPSDYGIFAFILVFSTFIAVSQDIGILQAIIRGNHEDTKYQEKLNTLSLFAGIFGTLCMCLFAIPLSMFYENHLLIFPSVVIGLTFALNSISIVPYAVLQQELNFRLIGKIQTASNLFAITCCGIAAYYGLSFWSLIIRELAYIILQLIILLNIRKIKFNFSLSEIKQTFIQIKKLAANMTGFGIINFFSRNTDNLLVGKIYGEEKLGIYNRAYSLIYLSINLVAGAFNQVLLPSLEKQDASKICKEYSFSTNLIAFFLFPPMLLFNIMPERITVFIWGEKWVEVTPLLPYIGILIFSQCQINIAGNIFVLRKKEKYLIWVAIINTVITVTGIVIGLYISFLDVIKFYTLFFIGISLPLTACVVYCTVLQQSFFSAIKFWLPKITILWFIFSLIWSQNEKNYLGWVFLSSVFYMHIFIQERNIIYRSIHFFFHKSNKYNL